MADASVPLRLLTVHAHPDDETITMGGLLALCDARGIATRLVCCTDGQLATIFDPEMAAREEEIRPRLGEIRREELRAAAGELGISEVRFLGYRDSGMAGAETNADPACFWRTDLDSVVERLVGEIREFRPQVVVTYDANGAYGHPDHVQAHRATLLAVEAATQRAMWPDAGEPWRIAKLYYTAFPRSWILHSIAVAKQAGLANPFGELSPEEMTFLTPDELVTTEIDVSSVWGRKRRALEAHRSQLTADFPLLAVPEELGREHFGVEHYQLALSRRPASGRESDVFADIAD